MAVLSGATASGRQMYANSLPTAQGIIYSAPALNSNVTSPSSTAYVKEIIICNYNASSVTVSILVGSVYILSSLTINGNDTKVLSGLNTMIPASGSISGVASTTGVHCVISGVEVQ